MKLYNTHNRSVCVLLVFQLYCSVLSQIWQTNCINDKEGNTHTWNTHPRGVVFSCRTAEWSSVVTSAALHFPSCEGQRLFHHWEVRGQRPPPPSPTAAPLSLSEVWKFKLESQCNRTLCSYPLREETKNFSHHLPCGADVSGWYVTYMEGYTAVQCIYMTEH